MKVSAFRMLSFIMTIVLPLLTSAAVQSRQYFLAGPDTQKYAVIFGGAAADASYQARFRQWTLKLHEILVQEYGYPPDHVILLLGRGDPTAPEIGGPCRRETILETMAGLGEKVQPGDQIFIFFVGHGTSDDEEAKFVIVGPDITGADFANILAKFSNQDIAVMNTTSSGYPFCNALSAAGRVIICATRSAAERYDTIFTRYLLEALEGHAADRDKNRRVSLYEVFLYVREKVKTWYTEQKRLPSEHPTINDTGDGRLVSDPDPARTEGGLAQIADVDTFAASLPEALAAGPAYETLRLLSARIHTLERSVILLRNQKTELSAQDYWQQLEMLLIDLARTSRRLKILRADLQKEYSSSQKAEY